MHFSDRVFPSGVYPGVILPITKEALEVLEDGSLDEAANKSVIFPETEYFRLKNVCEKESVVFLYILGAAAAAAAGDSFLKGTYNFPVMVVQDVDDEAEEVVTRCYLAKSETLPDLTDCELKTTLSELFFNSFQFYSDLDDQQVTRLIQAMRSKRTSQDVSDFPTDMYQPYPESNPYPSWQPTNYPSPSETQRAVPLVERGITPQPELDNTKVSVGVQISAEIHDHSSAAIIQEKDSRIHELETKIKDMEIEMKQMRDEVKRVTLEFFDGMHRAEYPTETPANQISSNVRVQPPSCQSAGQTRNEPHGDQVSGSMRMESSVNQASVNTRIEPITNPVRRALKFEPPMNQTSAPVRFEPPVNQTSAPVRFEPPVNQTSAAARFDNPINQGTTTPQIDPSIGHAAGYARVEPVSRQHLGSGSVQAPRNQMPSLIRAETAANQNRMFLNRSSSPNPGTEPVKWESIAGCNAGGMRRETAGRSPSPKRPSASPPRLHPRNPPWHHPVEVRASSPFASPTERGRLSPIQSNQTARAPGEGVLNGNTHRIGFGGYRQSDSPIAMPSSRGCSQECLALIGGLGSRGPVNGIEIFHPETNTWTPYLEFPSGMTFLSGASEVIDHNLFLIGGQVDKEIVKTVRRLNLQNHMWDEISETKIARKAVCSAKLRERIYLLGEKGRYSNSVETFDPHCNRWVRLPPMLFERARHDAASSPQRHCIYVFGGATEKNSEPWIEHFDPRSGSWTTVAAMNRFRPAACGEIMDDELHVIGGSFECTRNARATTAVEIFDLRTNKWRAGPDLNEHRWDAEAVFFQRSLYVIGGRNEDNSSRGVERLNQGSNAWIGGIPAGSLHATRAHNGIAILPPYL